MRSGDKHAWSVLLQTKPNRSHPIYHCILVQSYKLAHAHWDDTKLLLFFHVLHLVDAPPEVEEAEESRERERKKNLDGVTFSGLAEQERRMCVPGKKVEKAGTRRRSRFLSPLSPTPIRSDASTFEPRAATTALKWFCHDTIAGDSPSSGCFFSLWTQNRPGTSSRSHRNQIHHT